ncbi:acyl-CoA dehydrogenase family protein [Streptomyces sp. NPDC006368]|uniref:acyl-CoA dehydrogenase family protein n=1 Tax=Streptomyces sp. NPDC006368 TaxID=3156760 RepID=UPI0033A8877D
MSVATGAASDAVRPGHHWAHRAAAEASARAADAEDARTLHTETVTALVDAGFPRHFVPRRFGGATGTFTDLLEAVALVGERCTSAAWCAALLAAHGRLAAHLPAQALHDLWGAGPDVPIAAAVVPPAGTLTRSAGGWRLSGRWNLASAVDHAAWILLTSLEHTDDGPSRRVLVLPRRDIRVEDTWNNAGLRGTGSHSVTVDEAFVPDHRTVDLDTVAAGLRATDAARCHRIPYTLVASLIFAAPALGAARGALRSWTALTRARTAADGRPALHDGTFQDVLARSSAEIDAAQLLLERAAHRADHAPLGDLPVAVNMRDAAMAVDWLTTATDRLYRSAGARAQSHTCDLQRFWRDIHAVAAHAAVQLAPAAAAYARETLAG